MKNRINLIIVTIVTISLLFSFIGCKDPEPIELDQTAPAEVTNLTVTASNGNAVVTWENPSDLDLAGVQVAMSPAEGTLSNAVSVGKYVTSLNVSGLKIGSEYTFTVKTFDTSLNYSTGATEKATVADNSEKPDTTAPANVTNLVATNIATSVLLEWKDAQDADIFGYEVSWDKTIPVNRSVSMEANTMMIAPKTQGCYVSNLEIGESYTFTVKSVDLSGNKSAGQTATIIYTPNDAEISLESILIPDAGESYAGQILPVVIKGNNFKSPYFEVDTFEAEGVKNFQVISNTEIQAEIECPSTAGSYTVEVKCGALSKSTTYKVVEAEKCFNVGDILFTDGTRIKAENVKYGVPDSQMDKAFGVVAYTLYGGATGKVVGLQISSSILDWAAYDTTGYNTKFTGIQAGYSDYDYIDGKYTNYVFTGDMDGSDNWEEICKVDQEGTQDAATNYPAFNFALKYGETAGLKGTKYETGWYIPSVAELYDVYTNKDVVQASLTAAGGFPIDTSYYWSSSQYASFYDSACRVDFSNGYVDNYDKDRNYNVLVIQAFNAELFNNYEYAEPSITSVTIPTAGEGYTGELPVTIEGTNLKGHTITSSDTSFSNVTYASDTKVTATITCNGAVGETTVTVNCDEANGSTKLKVLGSAKCYEDADIGKIVLEDGSLVVKDDYGSNTMKAIAVVVGTKYAGGQLLGVGLQQASGLRWASGRAADFKTKFENIICTPSEKGSGAASTATFAGDIDGSDNWAYICSIAPEGTKDAATNYPAFDYANNYGVTQGITGNYKDGWYIPCLKELCDIYKVKDTVKDVITAVGGNLDMSSLYWSSSQHASYYHNAGYVSFSNGAVSYNHNTNNNNVLVIQAFNAE